MRQWNRVRCQLRLSFATDGGVPITFPRGRYELTLTADDFRSDCMIDLSSPLKVPYESRLDCTGDPVRAVWRSWDLLAVVLPRTPDYWMSLSSGEPQCSVRSGSRRNTKMDAAARSLRSRTIRIEEVDWWTRAQRRVRPLTTSARPIPLHARIFSPRATRTRKFPAMPAHSYRSTSPVDASSENPSRTRAGVLNSCFRIRSSATTTDVANEFAEQC
jgi:hypothetical protein